MEKQKLNVNEIYTINGVSYQLNEDLELIEVPKSIYNLKNGDVYYTLTIAGIHKENWISHLVDKQRLELENVFLTEEEAQFELERRKTITKIKCWKHENDNDYKFTYDKQNYYITINVKDSDIDIFVVHAYKDKSNYLYFSSERKARECLEFIGEENWKKYVLEIKE